MRDRDDFIENIKTVHTHLLILLDDIKYPLSEQHQKFLEVSEKAIGVIVHDMLKEDIEAVLREMGRQQQEGTGLFESECEQRPYMKKSAPASATSTNALLRSLGKRTIAATKATQSFLRNIKKPLKQAKIFTDRLIDSGMA